MEAVKTLEVQPRGTPRRIRARNVWTVAAGTGEALPGPSALRSKRGQRRPITGVEPGSGRRAGRASEAAVVPVEPQDNTTCGEGRAAALFVRGLRGGIG
jgi:hypothetical protein